jgi:hypothetical protein
MKSRVATTELHRAPRAVDFPSIDLLEAEDIRLCVV